MSLRDRQVFGGLQHLLVGRQQVGGRRAALDEAEAHGLRLAVELHTTYPDYRSTRFSGWCTFTPADTSTYGVPLVPVVGNVHQVPLPIKEQATVAVTLTWDDLYRTLPNARAAAARMPGATIVSYPSGGHLLLGRGADLWPRVATFLR